MALATPWRLGVAPCADFEHFRADRLADAADAEGS